MQEFSSISVSSYEPGTLADRLNERSADGWTVVAIVPTGSTLTAFLSREGSGATSTPSTSTPSTSAVSSAAEPSPVANVTPAPAASTAESTSDVDESSPSEPDTGISGLGMGASPAAIDPVDEPGGWAVTPESSSTPAASSSDQPSSSSSSSSISPELPSREPSSSTGPSSSSAADTGATAAAAATTGSAAAAPAGWYATPSSRYELRYWDGSQWTEHVSRAGQQFTDPPVA